MVFPNGKTNEVTIDDSSFSKMVKFDILKGVRTPFETKLVKQLVKQEEYDDIEIVKWLDSNPNKEFNKTVLPPEETEHFIKFKNTKKRRKLAF